jgi:hypothetical protein
MFFAPVELNILGIKLNAIDHGAAINLGPSQHLVQIVSYKRSQGIGEQNGDLSPTILPLSCVWDMDFIDSPTVKSSLL